MADLLGFGIGMTLVWHGLKKIGASLDHGKPIGRAPDEKGMRIRHHKVHSIEDKIAILRRLARTGKTDRWIRDVALSVLTKKCGPDWCHSEKDWIAEVKAIFGYMRRNVRYTRDIDGLDTFQHPMYTLHKRAADCDDMSITLAALLISIGYPVKFRVVRSRGASDFDHIYILAAVPPQNPTRWIPLDASVNKPPGWEPPSSAIAEKRDFLI